MDNILKRHIFLVLIVVVLGVVFFLIIFSKPDFDKEYCMEIFSQKYPEVKEINLTPFHSEHLIYEGDIPGYNVYISYYNDSVKRCVLTHETGGGFDNVYNCTGSIVGFSYGKRYGYFFTEFGFDSKGNDEFNEGEYVIYNPKYAKGYKSELKDFDKTEEYCEEIE